MLGVRFGVLVTVLATGIPAAGADEPSMKAPSAPPSTGDTRPGDPALLFQIATLHEKLGRPAKAYAYYEEYVRKARTGPHGSAALERLTALREHMPAPLIVNSSPAGAAVFVDAARVGDTPVQAMLAPGEHTIELRMANRPAVLRTVAASAGKQLVLSVQLPDETTKTQSPGTPAQGPTPSLSVSTSTGGAQLTVDGIFVGTTAANRGYRKHSIGAGVHSLRIARPGNHPWTARIQANPGDEIRLNLRLGHNQSPMAKIAAWSVGGIGAAFVVGSLGIGAGSLIDDNEDLARSADIMLVGGLSAVVIGGFIHWVTRDTPTSVDLTRTRRP